MHVIIGGAGEVGRGLAEALHTEGSNVYLIDISGEAVKEAQYLDAIVIHGDIVSREVLKKAGILHADVFIAATDSDERNLLSCQLAAHIAGHSPIGSLQLEEESQNELVTVARVTRENFSEEVETGHIVEWTGATHVVYPDTDAIDRLMLGLSEQAIIEVIPFGHDAYIIEVEVTSHSSRLANKTLEEAGKDIPQFPTFVARFRKGTDSMVPNRETVIVPGDRLAVATLGVHSFKNILAITGHDISETIEKPRTLIIGGGGIGILAASNQLAKGCLVTILESDLNLANAVVASENGSHKNLEVVHGEITDESLLDDIEIEKFDLAISSLKDEVQGIAAALIAHEAGVKMTGVILGDSSLANAARSMGITHVVNRRKVAIDSILKEVHHKLPGAYGLLGGERDIVGMSIKIREGHSWIGMPVNELKNDGMPEDCIIGYIQRDAHEGGMKTLRPKGDRKIRIGDRLLLFTPADRLHEMEDLMEG